MSSDNGPLDPREELRKMLDETNDDDPDAARAREELRKLLDKEPVRYHHAYQSDNPWEWRLREIERDVADIKDTLADIQENTRATQRFVNGATAFIAFIAFFGGFALFTYLIARFAKPVLEFLVGLFVVGSH